MAGKRQKCYSGIGGQAVLEGVMMKNQDKYAVAVRKPNHEIEIEVDEYKGVGARIPFSKAPFIRGVFGFVDSLMLGMKTLSWSASFFEEEDEKKGDSKSDGIMMAITMFISIVFVAKWRRYWYTK